MRAWPITSSLPNWSSALVNIAIKMIAAQRRTNGVHVSASRSELSSETVMVIARARKKLPVTPVTEMSGRKTTIGVIVEPISGTVISFSALWMA